MGDQNEDKVMDNKCIFCNISNKMTANTQLLYEDDNYVIIRDIRPVVDYHYLLITKSHIKNVKQMKTREGIEMIKDMKRIGLQFMSDQTLTDESQLRMGFHWPPFHSISHLHLHLLYPTSQMSWLSRIIFRPSFWFVEINDTIEWLSKQ